MKMKMKAKVLREKKTKNKLLLHWFLRYGWQRKDTHTLLHTKKAPCNFLEEMHCVGEFKVTLPNHRIIKKEELIDT